MQRLSDPEMKVFVEVYNPTRAELSLDSLRYRLVAKGWFDSRGEVKLGRVIAAGATAIVEISVPVQESASDKAMQGVPYTLKAQLIVSTDKTRRSWDLSSEGSLASARQTRLGQRMANRRVASGN